MLTCINVHQCSTVLSSSGFPLFLRSVEKDLKDLIGTLHSFFNQFRLAMNQAQYANLMYIRTQKSERFPVTQHTEFYLDKKVRLSI